MPNAPSTYSVAMYTGPPLLQMMHCQEATKTTKWPLLGHYREKTKQAALLGHSIDPNHIEENDLIGRLGPISSFQRQNGVNLGSNHDLLGTY